MSYPYFGVVESVFGDPGHSRIRVLARMSRGGDQRDLSFSPADLGSTRMVFLKGGAHEIGLMPGKAVRFDATENPREPRLGRDDDRFMVDTRNNKFCISIDTAALAVVKVERVDSSASRLRAADAVLARRRVYIHWSDRLEGPWQVEDDGLNLRPVRGGIYNSKRILSFPLETTGSAIYVDDWDPQEVRGYFLQEIEPHHGTPLDLATGKQLADWLLKLATRDEELCRALEELDQGFPGWRKRLRETFDELANDIDRAIYYGRLQRIEDIICRLELNSGVLRALSESRPFLGLWERAVEERRKELEEQARREFEGARIRLEQERSELTAAVASLRSEHRKFIEEREQTGTRIRSLLEHLKSERERLVNDVALINNILPAARSTDPPDAATAPLTTIDELLALQPCSTAGAAVTATSSREFSQGSLASALAYHGLQTEGSKLLHAAMLACRALLLPGPSWSRAYASALGSASARFLLLQVEPHWITFREAWRGGLAAAWHAAADDPEILVLVHIQDLDRALPDLWLRPVLDLLSGLRDTLPSGEPWPANLRVATSLAEGEAKLPLPPETTLYLATLLVRDIDHSEGLEVLPAALPTAQPAGTWTTWQRALPELGEILPLPRLAKVPMDLRRLVWEDVQRLTVALASLVDRPVEELAQKAFELRVAAMATRPDHP